MLESTIYFCITLRSPAVYAMAACVQNSEERAGTLADSAYTVGVERLVYARHGHELMR